MRSIFTAVPMLAAALCVVSPVAAEPMTLSRVLALADSAPRVAGARARVEVARAGLATSGRLLRHNPTLRAGLETDAPFGNDGDRTLSVGVEQTVELGGQQGLRREIAGAEIEDAAAGAKRARNDFIADVSASFHALDTVKRRVLVSRQVGDLFTRMASTAQSQLARGSITRLDVAALELEKSRFDAQLLRDAGMVEAAEYELAGLVGRPGLRIEPVGEEPSGEGASSGVESLVARALRTRPELAAARARQRSASGQETLAGREAWLTPTIGVGIKNERLVFGRDGLRFGPPGAPGLLGVDHRVTIAGVDLSIPLPLFEQRNTDRARARADRAVAAADETTAHSAIEAEVRAAAAQVRAASKALAAYEKTRVVAEEAAVLLDNAFARGAATVNDVLVGQERILRARLADVAARGELLRLRVELDRAVGAWADAAQGR